MDAFTQWITDIMDKEASPSFGRAGAATVIYFLLMWSTYLVFKDGKIPFDALFWMGLITFLYLGGKGIDAYQQAKGVTNADPRA